MHWFSYFTIILIRYMVYFKEKNAPFCCDAHKIATDLLVIWHNQINTGSLATTAKKYICYLVLRISICATFIISLFAHCSALQFSHYLHKDSLNYFGLNSVILRKCSRILSKRIKENMSSLCFPGLLVHPTSSP